jgi:threonine-phosphate decarboxylase
VPPSDDDIHVTTTSADAPAETALDFSGEIGTAPFPEFLRQALANPAGFMAGDPESGVSDVVASAAERFGVTPEHVAVGQGETEFLYAIPRALRPRRVLALAPCRHEYWRSSDAVGAESEGILAAEAHEFIPEIDQIAAHLGGVDMAVLGNPNNPTGVALPAEGLRSLINRFPSTTFVVDESYVEFVPESVNITLLGADLPPNLIILRTPSPLLGLPGLRLGFMIAHPELCGLVSRTREPGLMDGLTLAAARALLANPCDLSALREPLIAERERVRDELSRLTGLRVFRSCTGFLLIKITRPGLDFPEVQVRLKARHVIVRNAASYRGLDGKFLRICIRSPQENDRLLQAFRDAFDQAQWK